MAAALSNMILPIAEFDLTSHGVSVHSVVKIIEKNENEVIRGQWRDFMLEYPEEPAETVITAPSTNKQTTNRFYQKGDAALYAQKFPHQLQNPLKKILSLKSELPAVAPSMPTVPVFDVAGVEASLITLPTLNTVAYSLNSNATENRAFMLAAAYDDAKAVIAVSKIAKSRKDDLIKAADTEKTAAAVEKTAAEKERVRLEQLAAAEKTATEKERVRLAKLAAAEKTAAEKERVRLAKLAAAEKIDGEVAKKGVDVEKVVVGVTVIANEFDISNNNFVVGTKVRIAEGRRSAEKFGIILRITSNSHGNSYRVNVENENKWYEISEELLSVVQ